jgi:hypothetical protein
LKTNENRAVIWDPMKFDTSGYSEARISVKVLTKDNAKLGKNAKVSISAGHLITMNSGHGDTLGAEYFDLKDGRGVFSVKIYGPATHLNLQIRDIELPEVDLYVWAYLIP